MFDSTKHWTKHWLSSLVILLLLASASTSCSNTSRELSVIETTLEAANSQVESALTVAKTVEAEVSILEEQVITNAETAETALSLAQTAVASTPAPPSEPVATSTPGGAKAPIQAGLGLTYQNGDEQGLVIYPVDRLIVYGNYGELRSGWPMTGSARVRLALSTTAEDQKWQLFYADGTIVADPEVKLSQVTLTDWHEYLLSAYVPGGELVVDQGPGQEIITSTCFTTSSLFSTGETTGGSLLKLQQSGGNPNKYERLLLVDSSNGKIEYTLVIFFDLLNPGGPSGGDSLQEQCCRNCVWGLCKITCWIQGY